MKSFLRFTNLFGDVKSTKLSFICFILVLIVENVKSQCSPNPCINGNCLINSYGGFSCSCFAGFTGQRCDQYYIDPCATKPCNLGSCNSNDGKTFKCTCPPNYTGIRCETLTTFRVDDACASSPCLSGGTCIPITYANVNPPYACVCPPQLTGMRCEISVGGGSTAIATTTYLPNPCLSSPCRNGGSCLYNIQSTINPVYMCVCPPTYTGINCEQTVTSIQSTTTTPSTSLNLNACSSSPCLMGGTCINIPQTNVVPPYACVCPPQYTGERCQKLSALNPTVAPPTAVATTAVNYCSSNPCSMGSTCVSINTPNVNPPFACICPPNYTGLTCSTLIAAAADPCSTNPCVNGGTCRSISNPNVNPQYVCICSPQYSGQRCEQLVTQQNACSSNPCAAGSTCVPNSQAAGGFSCSCPPSYTGPRCTDYIQPNSCNVNSCATGSTCVPTSASTYSCYCPPSKTGKYCTDNIMNQPTTPITTNSNFCSSAPCQNGGTCNSYSFGYQCQCPIGYIGTNCETRQFIDLCNVNTCYNGGTCQTQSKVQDEYTVVCFCKTGFTGSRCQTSISMTTAASQPTCNCVNNGVCQSDGTCKCVGGFFGNRCEYYSNPTAAATTTQASSLTTPNACPAGLCINGYCQVIPQGGASYCICNVGWAGPRCNVRNYCQSPTAICQNGGTCVNNPNGYTCACSAGYSGSNCQSGFQTVSQPASSTAATCSVNCLNGGTCYFSFGVPTCLCPRGYLGLTCEVDVCLQKPIIGVCLGAYQRYYYNANMKQCLPFIYSGCRGNENNFETLDGCNTRCSGH